MQRLVVSLLLIGYVLLVPFCFLGNSLLPTADTMPNMMHNEMSTQTGVEKTPCCAQAHGVDALATHSAMYLIYTGVPVMAFVLLSTLLLLSVLLAVHFFSFTDLFRKLHTPLSFRVRKKRSLLAFAQRDLLAWLSQNETSPTWVS